MGTINEKYQVLIERISDWAENQDDIRAVLIQGSYARTDKPADEWSDLDLTLITTTPERYIQASDWVTSIGSHWLTFVEKTSDGNGMERRVMFEDGLDVDFAIFPLAAIQQMVAHGMSEEAQYTLSRGTRILVDKDGLLHQMANLDIKKAEAKPPTENEYLELVNDFIYHYIWTLKKLKRHELWTAKGCSDNYMKWRLLTMIEWHAHATKGWSYDTWHAGRFLEEWADPRVIKEMRASFALYEQDDILRALKETYILFRWLALEVAERLGFAYPLDSETKVFQWAEENLV